MPAHRLLESGIPLPCPTAMNPHRRLPPLESLRYFEAAARHGSFTRAAHELCLTQSAVSQKILALEDRLGYRLFERLPRGLRMTVEGEKLFAGVSAAFEQLISTVGTIGNEALEGTIKVRAMPSFATRWLMPRLARFGAAYPQVQLDIDAAITRTDFRAEDVDIAVSCEWTDDARLQQLALFDDLSYPVASPALLASQPLDDYADLANARLLHDSMPHANYSTNWDGFLTRLGRFDVPTRGGSAFSRADMVIQAACAGQGVALARHSLVADEIADGRLLRPFPDVMPEGTVYLVCPRQNAERPRIAAFIGWLQQEAAEHVAARSALLGPNH